MPRAVRLPPLAFLALALLLLSGCGGKPTTLRLAVWVSADDRAALQRQLDQFSSENKKIRVEPTLFSSPEECRDECRKLVTRGKAPDVCMIASDDLAPLLKEKALRDLSEFHPDPKPFLPETWNSFARDKKTYALPCGWSALVLYYNKAIFERHGVPTPRATWDWGDFLFVAQRLTVVDPATLKTTQYGIELAPDVAQWAPFIWQNNGELMRSGAWSLTEPQFAQSNNQAIEFFAGLVREHRVAPMPVKGKWRKSQGDLFASRKAAMTIAPRSLGMRLQNAGNFDWEITELPRQSRHATTLEVYGYAISASCSHPEPAWKLASFLSRETGQAALIQHGAYAPSWATLLKSRIFLDFPGPRSANNRAVADALNGARTLPSPPYWDRASTILEDEMLALMSNAQPDNDSRSAVERMQARLEELKLLLDQGVQPPIPPAEPTKPVVPPKVTPPSLKKS